MEQFSDQQLKILSRFVTSTSSNIFVLRNLPEVIKGALFSRYSRSKLGLRALLLKEFIENEEMAVDSIASGNEEQIVAIQKAQSFYDRILDGYGDDSIGELGGAHLAVEEITMLAAKEIEDCRIGGSPLEKSTRYIYYNQKINDEYRYYREPVLMNSEYGQRYIESCNNLFDTYSSLIPPLTEIMQNRVPCEEGVSKIAYNASIRAQVLDCLRGLLPASTLTNMGVFGNGRFFESLLQKLNCHQFEELRDIAGKSYEELSKVIPSFVRRSEKEHRHYKGFASFQEKMKEALQFTAKEVKLDEVDQPAVRLIDYEQDGPIKVAAALLFSNTNCGLKELEQYCRTLSQDELDSILKGAYEHRTNRRHKSPRALEHTDFTFEIVADFGIYRDLHRHRMLTQERQLLNCNLGYYLPPEIVGTEIEKPYCEALDRAKECCDLIIKDFPNEGQYAVPMAYNVHWYFKLNLRAMQWLCELRSAAAGHPGYRYIAQEMARQVSEKIPQFAPFLDFVDYEGHKLSRLDQEMRIAAKKEQTVS